MALRRIVVTVPATTANLGPGFDCLGMALDLTSRVSFEPSKAFKISVEGQDSQYIVRNQNNRVHRACTAVAERIGQQLPPLHITIHNGIPISRGLGSSASGVAAGLVGANALLEGGLPREELLRLGTLIEGHPDNLAPTLWGGCTLVVKEGNGYVVAPIPLPPQLELVLFIPDFPMNTQEARRVLPEKVERADAVFNVGRAALLTLGLATGKLDYLSSGTEDRLHQPWRQRLFPSMSHLFEAALEAGARGAFLSGAGSAVLAFADRDAAAIASALKRKAAELNIAGRSLLTRPRLAGATVEVLE